jgi:hypothetical protein
VACFFGGFVAQQRITVYQRTKREKELEHLVIMLRGELVQRLGEARQFEDKSFGLELKVTALEHQLDQARRNSLTE